MDVILLLLSSFPSMEFIHLTWWLYLMYLHEWEQFSTFMVFDSEPLLDFHVPSTAI